MPDPPPVPPEAVTAITLPPKWHGADYSEREIAAIRDRHTNDHVLTRDIPWLLDEIGWLNQQLDVLRVRHAEADDLVRQRFADTAVKPPLDAAEASAARIAELEELADNLRKALRRFENLEAAVQSKAALIAVAAERDRVVSLLQSRADELRLVPEVSAQVSAGAYEDAAELIGGDHD